MLVAICRFNDSNIVHISVTVQVKVHERRVRVIEPFLKILKVFGFAEDLSHHFQVEAGCNVTVGGRHGDRFVCACHQTAHEQDSHQINDSFHSSNKF